MTTTTKPLPPHGSEARYAGNTTRPPCHCRTCITGWTRAGTRRQLLRLAGTPATITGEEAQHIRRHILTCRNAGMSQQLIARKADVAQSTISRLLNHPDRGCLRAQGERILAVTPGRFDDCADRPATGTVRRIQGLYLAAHGPVQIAAASHLSPSMITELAGGRYQSVSARTETAVRRAVTELATRTGTCPRARRRAQREQWAPLGAWDDIDDPQAIPDWTGYCGTDRGYWTHRRQQLPMCPRCEQAHNEWLADHAHLSPQKRNQVCFRARATAVSREADLAADGRELLTYGVPVDQAAQRLGVTRNHLQQAMLRHPADTKEAA